MTTDKVTVKPLEWVKSHITGWNGDYHTVPTLYTVRCADENGWKWSGFGGHGYERSAEAAKAAAQSDYETRILSALSHREQKTETPGSHGSATAMFDVITERLRQQEKEGWTPEHDDEHTGGELAQAAACYTHASYLGNDLRFRAYWPWADYWWKPTDRRRNLVKAAALIIAEIERLDRSALSHTNQKTEGTEGEDVDPPAPEAHVVPCPCTLIEQDETCPVGYPSMLCEQCDGKGHLLYRPPINAIQRLSAYANGSNDVTFDTYDAADVIGHLERLSQPTETNVRGYLHRLVGTEDWNISLPSQMESAWAYQKIWPDKIEIVPLAAIAEPPSPQPRTASPISSPSKEESNG